MISDIVYKTGVTNMSVEEAAIRARQAIADQSAKLHERIDNPQDGKFLSSDEAYYTAMQLLHMFSTTILSSGIYHEGKSINYVLRNLEEFYKVNIQRLVDDIEKYQTKYETYGSSDDYWLQRRDRTIKEKEVLERRLQILIEDMKDVLDDR